RRHSLVNSATGICRSENTPKDRSIRASSGNTPGAANLVAGNCRAISSRWASISSACSRREQSCHTVLFHLPRDLSLCCSPMLCAPLEGGTPIRDDSSSKPTCSDDTTRHTSYSVRLMGRPAQKLAVLKELREGLGQQYLGSLASGLLVRPYPTMDQGLQTYEEENSLAHFRDQSRDQVQNRDPRFDLTSPYTDPLYAVYSACLRRAFRAIANPRIAARAPPS